MATYKFETDDEEEARTWMNAEKVLCAIQEFDEFLRNVLKYDDAATPGGEARNVTFNEVRNRLHAIFVENNLDINA